MKNARIFILKSCLSLCMSLIIKYYLPIILTYQSISIMKRDRKKWYIKEEAYYTQQWVQTDSEMIHVIRF